MLRQAQHKWKLLPRSIAAGSSAHDRFQEWREQGVMDKIWAAGLFEYDARKGIDWEWQSIDGAMTKAPLGGEATGANPTDRGKSGTKRSILTDGRGVPLGISVAGANRPDMELVKATLDSIAVERPEVTHDRKQHFLGDKGYDYQRVIELVEAREYIEHICRRGTDAHASTSLSTSDTSKIPGYRARRWVVERTHSWMNRFRRILIRWEKKVENYVALLKLAGAYIAFRAAGVVA